MPVNRRFFLTGVGASLAALASSQASKALQVHLSSPAEKGERPEFLLGADYYPDQTPEALWVEDDPHVWPQWV